MVAKVFIDGEAGTTGLQIRERLSRRRDLELISIPADKRKDLSARADCLNAADVAILCLPDDAARESVSLIENDTTRVIDASTAHRTKAGWDYGFAEMTKTQGAAIAASKRVSNPGCYPQGVIACLRPLIEAGLLPADYPVTINAISGYSGGGRQMIEAQADRRCRAHAADQCRHRHDHPQAVPEDDQALGLGKNLFDEMRYDRRWQRDPDFVLNQPAYREAQILVAGDNFGCGSSREHAPWALKDFGIRCVIAPSFADIFFNNCFKNGILPIVLPQEDVDKLMDDAERGANAVVSVDLETRRSPGPMAARSPSMSIRSASTAC
jgi:N-acetyl-gamma-glutamyl-phosphate reductase uncommon form